MAVPTLLDLDGFAHQAAQVSQAGSGFTGLYTTINNPTAITFDSTIKRLPAHVVSLKVAEDGVNQTNYRRGIAAGNRLIVGSLYFRATANPGNLSFMFSFQGPTNPPAFGISTTGNVFAQTAVGNRVSTTASYTDGLWHLLDFRADCSGTTFTIDWKIDGIAQTQQSSASQTAADFTAYQYGSGTTTHNLTVWFQDVVLSGTTGDYTIGPHVVLPLYPNGDGTSTLGTTNPIVNELGTSVTPWTRVDEWNGGLPNTTDYLTYTSTTLGDAASNFAELTFQDVSTYQTIWDVAGIIAGFASGTAACTADTQILTAHGGTLIDHVGNLIDYSGSASVLGYFKQKLARPSGGWTAAVLNAVVAQWGRATVVGTLPRLSAIMLEYAAMEASAHLGGPIYVNKQDLARSTRW